MQLSCRGCHPCSVALALTVEQAWKVKLTCILQVLAETAPLLLIKSYSLWWGCLSL